MTISNRLTKLEQAVNPEPENPFLVVYQDEGRYWLSDRGSGIAGLHPESGCTCITEEEYRQLEASHNILLVKFVDIDEISARG